MENILSKIQKLLAKAASTDSIHEREALLLKAQELLLEYNLDMSQVETLSGHEDIREESTFYSELWETNLLHCIAVNNFCETMRFTSSKKINVMGKPSNIAVVIYLYKFFHRSLIELGMKAYLKMCEERCNGLEPSKKIKDKYLLDYMLGGVQGINQRMKEQKEESSKDAGVYGIMVISDKKLEEYSYAKYPNQRKGRGLRLNTHSTGYCDGYRDGHGITSYNAVTSGAKQLR